MAAVTRISPREPAVLWRRLAAEFLGSGLLAAVVIGSGIAAQRLSPGETGLELLENAAATAAGLFAIILMFGVTPAEAADVVVPHEAAGAATAAADGAALVAHGIGRTGR